MNTNVQKKLPGCEDRDQDVNFALAEQHDSINFKRNVNRSKNE